MSWNSGAIPTARDIRAARQQCLAELESSGGTALLIRNRRYSKNDIIKTFDSLTSDAFLPYHLQVKQDRTLLNFLETGALSHHEHFKECEIYGDEMFLSWLAPHFAAAFAFLLKTSIDRQQPQDLARLLRENIKIADEYEAESWNPLHMELTKAIEFLKLYNDKNFRLNDEHLEHIKQLGAVPFLQMIKLKPELLFFDKTEEYTHLLHNSASRVKPHVAYCIFYNLLNLKLEYSLEEICRKNMAGLSGYRSEVHDVKSNGIPGRWMIPEKSVKVRAIEILSWIFCIIVFSVILVMNSDKSNKHDKNYKHYEWRHDSLSDEQKKLIDSITTIILTGDISLDSAAHQYRIMESMKRQWRKTKTDSNERQQ
jgi:hypothetical protein